MSRIVNCAKLGQALEGLDFQPFPGPLGQKVYENISKEASKQWLAQQTILINEYRLSSLDQKAQNFLKEEMQKFLFGGDDIELPDASQAVD